MSLERYDIAMKEKLKNVFPNVVFSSLSQVPANSADVEVKSQTADGDVEVKTKASQKVALPMIAFDRINNPLNFEFGANDPAIRRGRYVIVEEQNLREQTVPININYQIDILSDKRVEVDGIWRELVMYLYTRPNLAVKFLFDEEEYVEEFPIKMMETDNTTDIEDFNDKGRLYRQTLNIEIPQAKLIFDRTVSIVEEIPIHIVELGDGSDDKDS
jgi:hypothetical protein